MTGSRREGSDLTKHGIVVTERVPLIIPPNPHNRFYLETKATKSGHLIDLAGKERLLEQSDRPIVQGMTAEQVAAIENQ